MTTTFNSGCLAYLVSDRGLNVHRWNDPNNQNRFTTVSYDPTNPANCNPDQVDQYSLSYFIYEVEADEIGPSLPYSSDYAFAYGNQAHHVRLVNCGVGLAPKIIDSIRSVTAQGAPGTQCVSPVDIIYIVMRSLGYHGYDKVEYVTEPDNMLIKGYPHVAQFSIDSYYGTPALIQVGVWAHGWAVHLHKCEPEWNKLPEGRINAQVANVPEHILQDVMTAFLDAIRR